MNFHVFGTSLHILVFLDRVRRSYVSADPVRFQGVSQSNVLDRPPLTCWLNFTRILHRNMPPILKFIALMAVALPFHNCCQIPPCGKSVMPHRSHGANPGFPLTGTEKFNAIRLSGKLITGIPQQLFL